MDAARSNKEMLPEGHVHVWYALTDRIPDPGRLGEWRGLLDERERRRQARYLGPEKRREFLVSHALARTVLSFYAGIGPEEWEFAITSHGKPEICPSQNPGCLRFNLAHTQGLAACVVARNADVGIDVENLERKPDLRAIRRFFAPPETGWLETCDEAQRQKRFFELWTLKESYVKANGKGLSMGLDRFWFCLEEKRPPAVFFASGVDDSPQDWCFFLCSPTPAHVTAIAVHKGPAPDFVLKLSPWF